MIIKKISINEITQSEIENELKRMSPKKFEEILKYTSTDFKLSLAARIILRNQLNELYGCDDFIIKYTENGKPTLDFCYFSISHSGEYAVCAVSEKEIGVDIQKVSPVKKRNKYMLFSTEEGHFVNNSEDFETAFYTIWTMKEAYVKAIGGILKDAGMINLVSKDNKLKKRINTFSFKTYFFEGYIYSVCEKI